jgi:ABC-type uncharacterized transport system permease subunit
MNVPDTMAQWPDIGALLLMIFGFGVVAGVVTMVPAKLWDGWVAAVEGRTKPWWQNATLHLCALLIGMGVGWAVVGWPWGFVCGLAGGGIAAYCVGLLKQLMKTVAESKAAIGKSSEPLEEP